jgi:acyl carrier protein
MALLAVKSGRSRRRYSRLHEEDARVVPAAQIHGPRPSMRPPSASEDLLMNGDERRLIREFITTQLAKRSEHRNIGDRDDVISMGVIDSLGIMHLIAYLESTFELRIRDDEIVPENFSSIEAIATFVERCR